MGKKTECLVRLVERHINVHEFKEICDYDDLWSYALENKMFTIRFDRYFETESLPFYVIVVDDYEVEELKEKLHSICSQALEMECSMLCSNGLQYDKIMLFNFVGIICGNSFEIEFCTRPVPLRKMYEYPTTVVRGSLNDDYSSFEFSGSTHQLMERDDLEKILFWLIHLGYMNQHVEASYYQRPVGVYQERIVCWQVI